MNTMGGEVVVTKRKRRGAVMEVFFRLRKSPLAMFGLLFILCLAFVAIFAIVMILVKLLEHILRGIISGLHLGGVNKFLGLVFGLIEGITLTMLVIFLIDF